MSWKYRHSGKWNDGTIKRRKNGEWVEITSKKDDSQESDTYYGPAWRDPPERSKRDFVSNHRSLSDAISNVDPDTILYLDNGPYMTSGLTISTNHVTVSGEGYTDAVINHDYTDDAVIRTTDASYPGTRCEPVNKGDTTITGVEDMSLFSVGDDIRIIDPDDQYTRGNPGGSGSLDTATKGQFTQVKLIDHDAHQLIIEPQSHLDFTDEGSLQVQRVDWGVEDIHFDAFDLSGDGMEDNKGSSTRFPFIRPRGAKDVWCTNMYFEELYGFGLSTSRCLNVYASNCETYRTRYYGCSLSSGTTNGHVHNWHGDRNVRYALSTAIAPAMAPSYHLRGYGTSSQDLAYTDDAHFGVENVIYSDSHGEGRGGLERLRGHDQHVKGGHYVVTGSDNQQTGIINLHQWPEKITIEDITTNQHSYDYYGVYIAPGADSWTVDGLKVINCDMYGGNHDPFVFHGDVTDLYVRDYYWNGSLVTSSDIENSYGYDQHLVDYRVDNTV